MRRPPPSDTTPDATLLEKHPELEFHWRPGTSHAFVLKNYEQFREYNGTNPIQWKKPDAFRRADRACGEAVGTLAAFQKLATLASDDAFEMNPGQGDAGERQTLLMHMRLASQQLIMAQLQLERLMAVTEYRWLQENVPGDFTAMPASMRKQYTNTPLLLDNKRFEGLRAVIEDPAKAVPLLEEGVATQFEALEVAINELEQHMRQQGPLFGLHDRGFRMIATRDHSTCLDVLLPHVRAQIGLVEKELPTLGRFAVHAMATHRNGQEVPPPPVSYLDVPFKEQAPVAVPNPNAVDSVVRVDFKTKKPIAPSPENGPGRS